MVIFNMTINNSCYVNILFLLDGADSLLGTNKCLKNDWLCQAINSWTKQVKYPTIYVLSLTKAANTTTLTHPQSITGLTLQVVMGIE